MFGCGLRCKLEATWRGRPVVWVSRNLHLFLSPFSLTPFCVYQMCRLGGASHRARPLGSLCVACSASLSIATHSIAAQESCGPQLGHPRRSSPPSPSLPLCALPTVRICRLFACFYCRLPCEWISPCPLSSPVCYCGSNSSPVVCRTGACHQCFDVHGCNRQPASHLPSAGVLRQSAACTGHQSANRIATPPRPSGLAATCCLLKPASRGKGQPGCKCTSTSSNAVSCAGIAAKPRMTGPVRPWQFCSAKAALAPPS